jgi:PGF-pre-PGF domain-containing protein
MDGKECINGTCHEPVIPVCVGELCDVEENESGEYEDKELLERYEEYRNETDNYKKINLSRENRFMLKNNEWKKYRSVEKLRSSMIQEYETDAGVQVNLSETKADITVEKVDAKKAVMINISREPEAILGEAEVAAAREVMAVTTLDIGVVNDVEDIQLEVERLEAKPEHVTEAPAGGVYQYIEIEKREIVDEDIEDVGIDFRVDKSWLSEKNITNNSQVALYRLEDGDWKEVSTIWIGEDDLYSYYQSFSPGLSYFVIGITGAASSPIELELPGERGDALAGTGADEIARIKFNWEFVLIVIVVVVILVLLKYTPIPGKMAGIFNRESVQDLQKKLTDFKGEREEALNRYYKREITKEQMEEIVNDIKKKEFDVEMRIKRMQEKKSQNTQS